MPLISIALLSYNHEELLPKNLRSFLNQTDQEFELILVDNQSTDNSHAIMEQFRVDHPQMKIIVIRNHTRTVCEGRRVGVNAASGEYIALHDGDDWLEPTYVELHRKAIVENQYPDAIACGTKTISATGETLNATCLPEEQTPWVKRTMQGYMVKRAVFEACNSPFADTFFEDLYLSCSLNCDIKTVTYIRQPLYCYFVNDNSANSKARMQKVGTFVEPFDHVCALIWQNLYSNVAKETKSLLEFQMICNYYSLVFAGSVYLNAENMFQNYILLRQVIRKRFPNYLKNEQIRLRGSNCLSGSFKRRLWLAANLERLDNALHVIISMRVLLWVYWLALKLKVYRARR